VGETRLTNFETVCLEIRLDDFNFSALIYYKRAYLGQVEEAQGDADVARLL
jgi:hypothetical protein